MKKKLKYQLAMEEPKIDSKFVLFLAKICNKFFRKFILIAVGENRLSEIGRFERDGWDEVLFRNLNLNKESKVLVLGGYKGASTLEYRKRFDSNVLALEPIQNYFEILENKFVSDSKVSIQNLALAAATGKIEIYINDDSTGFYEKKSSSGLETITCVGVRDFFVAPFEIFDLIEMNIEGAEYEVLNSILQLNLQTKFKTFLIQFHRNIPSFESKRESIRRALEISHKQVFCYDYVWERWDLKTSS